MSSTKLDRKDSLRAAWIAVTGEAWPFEPEYRFDTERRWRFDWAHTEKKLAVEVEGVTHFGPAIGRHQSAKGIEGDMEKYNRAIELGWRVLRYSQRMIQADPHAVVSQIVEVAATA